MVRQIFWVASLISFALLIIVYLFLWKGVIHFLDLLLPLFFLGLYDIFQKRSNILRLYPIVGHFRYLFEGIRPQIRQYFIESNQSGRPFNREQRELVYQRAEKTMDTLPFGTQRDVSAIGFDWINHSMAPKVVPSSETRILVGGLQCTKPYLASRLNISAMSFGSLSNHAIIALNRGAKMEGFAHNTGEGGLSAYHLQEGGDLIWQIGTGYFGCRKSDGTFDEKQFQEKATLDVVKMIEIKISQGAKPSHGGILPAVKLTEEIATIRGVPMGADVISPPTHSAYSTPEGLLHFVARLRELTDGKPIGFKLCIGERREFLAICKAMLKTNILPDFITVDGSEGGTGAAPLEFTDYVGTPLNEGLVFVHNSLTGIGKRDQIRIIGSGKIISGFDMVCKMAMGAELCNSARGMMFALGCVQSRRCNKNTCPTGITTQEPRRVYALHIGDKAPLVANFHRATLKSFLEVLGASGFETVAGLTPGRVYRRVGIADARHYDEIYKFLQPNQLLEGPVPPHFADDWAMATAETF